jgi:signal transduction histidine kinase
MVMVLNVRHQKDNFAVNPIASFSIQREACKNINSNSLAQEFKSPLGTMLGMLDLLLTTAMTLKQKEYIEVACSSGRSLMSI